MSGTGDTTEQAEPQQQPTRPLLRVVRGNPDDAEIAALTAVVTSLARAGTAKPASAGPRSHWADRAMLLRKPAQPGPGAWWASALPR